MILAAQVTVNTPAVPRDALDPLWSVLAHPETWLILLAAVFLLMLVYGSWAVRAIAIGIALVGIWAWDAQTGILTALAWGNKEVGNRVLYYTPPTAAVFIALGLRGAKRASKKSAGPPPGAVAAMLGSQGKRRGRRGR